MATAKKAATKSADTGQDTKQDAPHTGDPQEPSLPVVEVHGWVEVTDGDHSGRYGVYVQPVEFDKDNTPTKALIKTRDEHDEYLVVDVADLAPSVSGKR